MPRKPLDVTSYMDAPLREELRALALALVDVLREAGEAGDVMSVVSEIDKTARELEQTESANRDAMRGDDWGGYS